MDITQTTTSATSNHHPLSIIKKVSQHLIGFGITNNRSTGDGQHKILPFRSMHLLTRPGLTRLGLKTMFIAIIDQRVEVMRCFKVDATTTSAIATVRSTKGS